MSTTEATIIPYERQSDPQTNRKCGAACLSMVYRSLGKEITEAQVWPAIGKQNRFGSFASTTHLMAQDALNRGFAAVTIQVRHPLLALKLCRDSGIRAILNHRLKNDVTTGHYSVLVDIDEKYVVLHDPFYGPSRRLPHAELLALWQRRFPSSEISGNVLIGISAQSPAETACHVCRTPIPAEVNCPRCKNPVVLQPAALLGCMNSACAERMWNYLCCPSCDYTWTFSLQPARGGGTIPHVPSGSISPVVSNSRSLASKEAPAIDEDPLNLGRLFGELDKFCGHILGLPAAADDPEIKRQLEFIATGREKLMLALAEQRSHCEESHEQLAALLRVAAEKQEAHCKRVEELNRLLPPIDGDALGRALLKNLGLN